MADFCRCGVEISVSIKYGEFMDELGNCRHFKKESTVFFST